ncbi:MAG: transposase [Planctomycetia bacterium]|nr:transposase [Planctomycetia bacterium]MCC7315485.1 transposase [Planctomycetota bacterium]
MSARRFNPEEIVNRLREADVLIAQRRTSAHAGRWIGVTEQTCYRRRKEHGGLKTDQAKRLKELNRENARLKRLARRAAQAITRIYGQLILVINASTNNEMSSKSSPLIPFRSAQLQSAGGGRSPS